MSASTFGFWAWAAITLYFGFKDPDSAAFFFSAGATLAHSISGNIIKAIKETKSGR